MKLKWIHIKNYRSCNDVIIQLGPMHALVGSNNAGKSTIIRALDFLFNPAKGKIDEEAFWNGQIDNPVWVEGYFDELTEEELANEKLLPYLRPEGAFHIARSARLEGEAEEEGEATSSEKKITISQHYCKPSPMLPWLKDSEINGNNITEWWGNKDQLTLDNGISFADFLGGAAKPKVGDWKQKAKEFIDEHKADIHFEDSWIDNPQGYAGVLKGTLPHYIFVPAVKDVTDEAKVTKTNPFGQLLYKILDSVSEQQKTELEGTLKEIEKRLNRKGGNDRLQSIIDTEKRLNQLLGDYMPCDLEIEFQAPTIETLLTTPQLFADDGYRNIISNKGHGLQRAIIFSILRCYSEQVTGTGVEKKKPMIFAVEEPELYMHPQAQRAIRRAFRDIAQKGDQVFFTTHSALLVDVSFFDEIVRLESSQEEVDGKKVIQSKVWQLPMERMIKDLKARLPQVDPTGESMRELYAHAYHPNRSEGFFAKSVLLVEGATEQYALPLYAEACGFAFDSLNISVVDCGGKGQMDRLYRIFNELGIPCYLLFDYDKDNEDNQIVNKSKELQTLLGDEVAIPTNISIKDRYACFPSKWEVDLNQEIENVDQMTTDARKLLGVQKGSGKPLVARFIAKKLTSQAPPIVPPSIKKIIEKSAIIKWEKSCLKK